MHLAPGSWIESRTEIESQHPRGLCGDLYVQGLYRPCTVSVELHHREQQLAPIRQLAATSFQLWNVGFLECRLPLLQLAFSVLAAQLNRSQLDTRSCAVVLHRNLTAVGPQN